MTGPTLQLSYSVVALCIYSTLGTFLYDYLQVPYYQHSLLFAFLHHNSIRWTTTFWTREVEFDASPRGNHRPQGTYSVRFVLSEYSVSYDHRDLHGGTYTVTSSSRRRSGGHGRTAGCTMYCCVTETQNMRSSLYSCPRGMC